MKIFPLLFFFFSLFSSDLFAQIHLEKLLEERVDLSKLQVGKAVFFDFVAGEIQKMPLGVGANSQVSFDVCHFPYKGQPLENLKTKAGKDIKYLSTPSCQQLILRKLLVQGYGYKPFRLSPYRDRQCMLNIIKLMQPLFVVYSLQIEEPAKGKCDYCVAMSKYQAKKVVKLQDTLNKFCGVEAGKVGDFTADLSQTVEAAMRKKAQALSSAP